jgi:hypothetical protein
VVVDDSVEVSVFSELPSVSTVLALESVSVSVSVSVFTSASTSALKRPVSACSLSKAWIVALRSG